MGAFEIPPGAIFLAFSAIMILSAVGNSCVTVAFYRLKTLKGVTSLFMMSLSFSNLLMGVAVTGLALFQTVWDFSTNLTACKTPLFVELTCVTASIYSLVSVSLDRYVAVVHPTSHLLTFHRAKGLLLMVWVGSVLYASRIPLQITLSPGTSNTAHPAHTTEGTADVPHWLLTSPRAADLPEAANGSTPSVIIFSHPVPSTASVTTSPGSAVLGGNISTETVVGSASGVHLTWNVDPTVARGFTNGASPQPNLLSSGPDPGESLEQPMTSLVTDDGGGDVDRQPDGVSDDESIACNFFLEEDENDLHARLADIVVLFLLPLVAMGLMYARIAVRLWGRGTAVNEALRRKRKVVNLLVATVIVFTLSWIPFYMIDFISDSIRASAATAGVADSVQHDPAYVALRFSFVLLALSTSCTTPAVHLLCYPPARQQALRLLFPPACLHLARRLLLRGHGNRVQPAVPQNGAAKGHTAVVNAAFGSTASSEEEGQSRGTRRRSLSTDVTPAQQASEADVISFMTVNRGDVDIASTTVGHKDLDIASNSVGRRNVDIYPTSVGRRTVDISSTSLGLRDGTPSSGLTQLRSATMLGKPTSYFAAPIQTAN